MTLSNIRCRVDLQIYIRINLLQSAFSIWAHLPVDHVDHLSQLLFPNSSHYPSFQQQQALPWNISAQQMWANKWINWKPSTPSPALQTQSPVSVPGLQQNTSFSFPSPLPTFLVGPTVDPHLTLSHSSLYPSTQLGLLSLAQPQPMHARRPGSLAQTFSTPLFFLDPILQFHPQHYNIMPAATFLPSAYISCESHSTFPTNLLLSPPPPRLSNFIPFPHSSGQFLLTHRPTWQKPGRPFKNLFSLCSPKSSTQVSTPNLQHNTHGSLPCSLIPSSVDPTDLSFLIFLIAFSQTPTPAGALLLTQGLLLPWQQLSQRKSHTSPIAFATQSFQLHS